MANRDRLKLPEFSRATCARCSARPRVRTAREKPQNCPETATEAEEEAKRRHYAKPAPTGAYALRERVSDHAEAELSEEALEASARCEEGVNACVSELPRLSIESEEA